MSRQSKGNYRDKHGRQSARVGTRSDNRVFMFNRSWSSADVDRVKQQLKDVFDFWGKWNASSNAVADSLRKGVNPVPIPTPVLEDLPEWLLQDLVQRQKVSITPLNEFGFSVSRVPLPEIELPYWEATLRRHLPSINWASLGQSAPLEVLKRLRSEQMAVLQQSADTVASIDSRPSTTAIPVKGTLQQALKAYEAYVLKSQPTNWDRHGKIKQLIERHPDIPLATLDIEQCRVLIDYWCSRPERQDKKGRYSAKRSREQLYELDNFFTHTHVSTDFAWRKPEDFDLLNRKVAKDKSKESVSVITHKLVPVADLKKLMTQGSVIQRLIATWCINCSHGAGEIGRVQWGDLFLNQDHPWKSQGLQVEPGGNWVGFLRNKSSVVGWWQLWPETIQLLEQWKPEAEEILQRKVKDDDRLIINGKGNSLYNEDSKNGQSKFAERFNYHVEVTGITRITLGRLRKQLSDWIATKKADAVVSSLALGHGKPHSDDKILFAHYSNKPWVRLFEYQQEFRHQFFEQNSPKQVSATRN
ncbi:hypothetical protein GCM10023156_02090 [Novipirellula rosea]|uniref:Tyr recombinase domain-containing protein n=2 Tax=Novipirellula rosea TaxID=1031540 RepID=A0ABP8M689_9BACT